MRVPRRVGNVPTVSMLKMTHFPRLERQMLYAWYKQVQAALCNSGLSIDRKTKRNVLLEVTDKTETV